MFAIACNTLLIYSGYFFYSDIISQKEKKALTVCIVILIISSVIILGIFVLYDLFPRLRMVIRNTRIEKSKKVLRRNHLLTAKKYLARIAGLNGSDRIKGVSSKDAAQHMANVESYIGQRVKVWYTKLRVVSFFMIAPRKKYALLAFKRILKPKPMDKFRHWLLRQATDEDFEEVYYVATKINEAMVRMPALAAAAAEAVEVKVDHADESIETLAMIKEFFSKKEKAFERPPEIRPRLPAARRYRSQGLLSDAMSAPVLEAAALYLSETHRNVINQHLEAMANYTIQVTEAAFRDLMFEDGDRPRFLYDPPNVNQPDESWLPKILFTRRQGLNTDYLTKTLSSKFSMSSRHSIKTLQSTLSVGLPHANDRKGSTSGSGEAQAAAAVARSSKSITAEFSIMTNPIATIAGQPSSSGSGGGLRRARNSKGPASLSGAFRHPSVVGDEKDDAEYYPPLPTFGGGLGFAQRIAEEEEAAYPALGPDAEGPLGRLVNLRATGDDAEALAGPTGPTSYPVASVAARQPPT